MYVRDPLETVPCHLAPGSSALQGERRTAGWVSRERAALNLLGRHWGLKKPVFGSHRTACCGGSIHVRRRGRQRAQAQPASCRRREHGRRVDTYHRARAPAEGTSRQRPAAALSPRARAFLRARMGGRTSTTTSSTAANGNGGKSCFSIRCDRNIVIRRLNSRLRPSLWRLDARLYRHLDRNPAARWSAGRSRPDARRY